MMKQLTHRINSYRGYWLIMVIFSILTSCQTSPSLDQLKEDISNRLAQTKGTFAIAFKDLSSGETLLINEKEVFHAASTMKTPLMIEIFKQAAEGKFSLDDSIIVKNEFRSIVDSSTYQMLVDVDSYSELYDKVGTRMPMSELVYDMIIVSSNLATNILIEYVGAPNVTQSMREMGAPDIQVLRGVEDQKAYDKGLSNTTTAYDLMVIFEKMAMGEAVNPEADQQMIDILFDQHFNEIIPAKLPKDVKVAHKTGSITGVQHDSGIIFLPDGRKYVLVTLSKDLEDANKGISAMADVSASIYQFISGRDQ